ncbi:pyrimidine dimer DNA glycosylase/endonuclease V [Pseudochrobactrum kiredjianiae]|uniref:Pyrimidine dimer DNA glycosylase/endonuclease V n=1 Tax=Pseudochrobactrum kiredjianiae TaxID=386305 RepID=A0ABW3V2W8_9HYPH|nr:pyrimidine dimer DNA glycosylase/endonuclease V [Pseudochrobactrum kiredjianiae]MDM7851798.1 pyrimidine dimer DNA glycosylase/endonuclease V [Pseudochrobactrum kiredjianiae]
MTRINCIPPQELTGPHLVAEYRELPRIFTLARAAIERGEKPDDPRNPRSYTLGKGHVRFFYPRLGFLVKRQQALIDEMLRREYQPSYRTTEHLIENIPALWCADWQPDEAAIALNKARIAERLNKAPSKD